MMTDEIGLEIAADFRRRRIEKNLTREFLVEKAGIPMTNVVRFEPKSLSAVF